MNDQPRQPAGTSDGGRFAAQQRSESAVTLDEGSPNPGPAAFDLAAGIAARFVAPVTCRRCHGEGLVASRVVHAGGPGGCYSCDGWGVVESDPATIAAAKARSAAAQSIITDSIAEAERRGLPRHTAMALSYGISHLADHAPDRYEKALASHVAKRPDLFRALVVYTAEHGYFRYGATPQTPAQMLERLDLT